MKKRFFATIMATLLLCCMMMPGALAMDDLGTEREIENEIETMSGGASGAVSGSELCKYCGRSNFTISPIDSMGPAKGGYANCLLYDHMLCEVFIYVYYKDITCATCGALYRREVVQTVQCGIVHYDLFHNVIRRDGYTGTSMADK